MLSTAEYLDFAADSRGLEGSARRAAIERSVESCGLAPVYRRTVEELSKGFRQRLGLAQAILHDPPILILGAAPRRVSIRTKSLGSRALIRELGHEKTVILSTHKLQEVEAVCSRVIILNEGTIAAQGRPEEIGETLKGEERVRLRVKSSRSNEPLDAGRLESLFTRLYLSARRRFAPGHAERRFSAELVFAPAAGEPGEILFDWAVADDLKLLELEQRRLSLEEIFVKLTSEGGTE